MARVTIVLREDESKALVKLASTELRDPRDQARFLLRSELERRGLLQPESASKADTSQEAPR